MIIKGGATSGASALATHLQRLDTNSRAEILDMRGVAGESLREAFSEMEAVGSGTKTKRPLYHASLNILANEHLTPEQWMLAIDRLEAELGLTGQPRAVVLHVKEGREHRHVVWSRTDLEHMRAIRMDHNYRTHEKVARALEREFGLSRVQGAHMERDDVTPRPQRTPSHAEMQQAERTGISPQAARDHINALWQRTDSGRAFAEALTESGWILARGDRRDFVAIDPKGGAHSLARRIEGATAKDVRARLSDIDPSRLPGVGEARETQRGRAGEGAIRDREPSHQPARREAPDMAAAGLASGFGGAARAADGVGKVASVALDGIASLFESVAGGGSMGAQKEAPEPSRAPPPPAPHEIEEAARAVTRQALLAEFGQDVPPEIQQEFLMDRGRERSR